MVCRVGLTFLDSSPKFIDPSCKVSIKLLLCTQTLMGTTLTFLPGVAIDRQDLTTDKTIDCIKSLSQGPRGGR